MPEDEQENLITDDALDIEEPSVPKKDKRRVKSTRKSAAREKGMWEDGLVSSKRVARFEVRRIVKKATVILLVSSIAVTSVVYVMLKFIDQNNIRITASSSDENKSITLSMDNENWSPYLDALGPEFMRDITYNPQSAAAYDRERTPSRDEALALVATKENVVGNRHGKSYIAFGFMLRNNSNNSTELPITFDMDMTTNANRLDKAIRVMWAEIYGSDETSNKCDIYAAYGDNPRLAALESNKDVAAGRYIEKIAYPVGSETSGNVNYDLARYERVTSPDEKTRNGFEDTVPFVSNEKVFSRSSVLKAGEIMYVYVCVWIEGSDFDCIDDKLGGYVQLGINFKC